MAVVFTLPAYSQITKEPDGTVQVEKPKSIVAPSTATPPIQAEAPAAVSASERSEVADDIPPIPPHPSTWKKDDITSYIEPLYALLVVILSYLSWAIPYLNKIKDTLARTLAIGIVLGLGFLYFGSSFISIAITYIFANASYLFGLKAIFKTPKVAGAEVKKE